MLNVFVLNDKQWTCTFLKRFTPSRLEYILIRCIEESGETVPLSQWYCHHRCCPGLGVARWISLEVTPICHWRKTHTSRITRMKKMNHFNQFEEDSTRDGHLTKWIYRWQQIKAIWISKGFSVVRSCFEHEEDMNISINLSTYFFKLSSIWLFLM